MKKVKLFLMFILGMLIFSINVKAADTYGIKCDIWLYRYYRDAGMCRCADGGDCPSHHPKSVRRNEK